MHHAVVCSGQVSRAFGSLIYHPLRRFHVSALYGGKVICITQGIAGNAESNVAAFAEGADVGGGGLDLLGGEGNVDG